MRPNPNRSLSCAGARRRRALLPFVIAGLCACGEAAEPDGLPPGMMAMDPPTEMPKEMEKPPEPPIPSKEYSAAHPLGYYPTDTLPAATAYLTIDDGPSEYTLAFLDVLKQKSVKATFFINAYGLKGAMGLDGSYVDPKTMQKVLYRDVLKRIVDDGHTLGNHTMHHPHLETLSAADLTAELDHNQALVSQALIKAGGKPQPLTLVRPPYGAPFISRLDDSKLTEADRMMLRTVGAAVGERGLNILWNLDSSDSADWAKDEWYTTSMPQPPDKASKYTFAEKVERIKQTVLKDKLVTAKKGVVILFHDTHPCTRDALGDLIDGMGAAGYSFATVEELAQARWQRPSAELTPGPELYNDRFAVRDWGCADFSKALGKPARTRAHEICGRTWRVFSDNGGAPVFGRPLAAPDAGSRAPGQWLEKVRLELHPEEDRPFDVTPGRLGLERLMQLGIDWRTSPLVPFQEEAAQKPGCLLLTRPATDGGRGIRHNVCDSAAATPTGTETATGFLAFWKQLPDGLAALGYPVSAAYLESESGRFVQWFERGRLERAPASTKPELTALGSLLYKP
ncbi:MAG: polysaccharide deacetylase family protein [Polyangia bacterium]